jgi:LacI family gluconate utilization system Gnt-I transcriptional repressor
VPTLTSVRTNRYEMGRNAANMVIQTLEGRPPERRIVDLGFTVMERQSSVRENSSEIDRAAARNVTDR